MTSQNIAMYALFMAGTAGAVFSHIALSAPNSACLFPQKPPIALTASDARSGRPVLMPPV